MISITELKAFLQQKQTDITAINSNHLFIDDSQLTAVLREVQKADNTILVGLIPSHKTEGANIDTIALRNSLLFMLLNKTDRNVSHEEFLTNMQQCQDAAKEFVKSLINDATDDTKVCEISRLIDVNSITIDPIWKLAGCDGYAIEMQLKTNLWA